MQPTHATGVAADSRTTYLHAPQDVVAANYLGIEQGTFDLKDFEQLRQQFWQQITLNPLQGESLKAP
ncbi:MAG TPA: hypothetical protein DD001_16975 [Microcoleaceae bacterium UBA10368]|nr:hypothetical protein [Microcoleaceae cyanobacterium UBA10368]HCV30013.1 hypothetical protein [Microcoleaceae cyanobacterium UBA9251]